MKKLVNQRFYGSLSGKQKLKIDLKFGPDLVEYENQDSEVFTEKHLVYDHKEHMAQ